jgi:hypothetical protein
MSTAALKAKVLAQKTLIPSLYGEVDFSIVPERFAGQAGDDSILPGFFARKYRAGILADKDRVERALAYTMLGDTVADAYAALIPQYGFRRLVDMLKQACDHGIDHVQQPPQELVEFIHAMETVPDWVDMKLVREGARVSRIFMATFSPFVIRGAFVATFMNKYSGLPMALTGTLSDESSVQRIKETASFFTTATLPGALERYGPGFKAAAMVRLMHSMVRFNILKRSKKWDVSVYGIPVPQVDQMPAGTMGAFITAFQVIRSGREHFTAQERAIVELSRYQCYLLGLPQDLLPDTPREIFNAMMTYAGTLRDGYDDETMGAYLPQDHTLKNRVFNFVEKSFSKVYFTQVFLVRDDKGKARQMGVQPDARDYLLFAAGSLLVLPHLTAHKIIERVPIARHLADKVLVRKLNEMLVSYGHAEYTTDPAQYKEATA